METTDYPVENITFPTVTVCRDENEPNCFEFVSKIFDFAEFPCFDEGFVLQELCFLCFLIYSGIIIT